MKGVILAGGKGTRMLPLTKVTNKHLLPVGGKPMLQHSIDKMVEASITEILIITGGEHLGAIAEFCGSGRDFGCEFTYRVQDETGGIAQALGLAEGFVREGEYMCVILGDNVFQDSLKEAVFKFEGAVKCDKYPPAAQIMLKSVEDPERFGVAEVKIGLGEEAKTITTREEYRAGVPISVVGIEEKPENPKSNFAVTGVYFYFSDVFDIIGTLNPSHRGELEITDVNNEYIRRRAMTCGFWDGWWTDAGTPESYRKANKLVEW